MTDFTFTSPEGKKYTVSGPEGATQQQAFQILQGQLASAKPKSFDAVGGRALPTGSAEARAAQAPTAGMTGTQQFLAGAGKSYEDLGRGARQLAASLGIGNRASAQADIDAAKARDAPLMASGAGRAGNIVGDVATTLPAAAIPGAGTAIGAAGIGAGLGALQPTASGESRTANVLGGAVGGLGGKVAGDVASKGLGFVADKLGRIRPAGAATEAGALMEQGYKLPPSYAKVAGAKPGALASWAEGFGGKVKTEQAFSAKNQANTNRLVRKGLGLGEGDKVTPDEVRDLRETAGETYEALKNWKGQFTGTAKFNKALDAIEGSTTQVSRPERAGLLRSEQVGKLVESLRGDYSPDEAVEILKKLRADAGSNIRSLDAPTKALGRAQRQAASALEGLIDEHLSKDAAGKGLYKAFTQARKTIAMSYDVEKALNETTGNVSAVKLAKLLGKRPLSGELEKVAKFGKGYSGIAREVEQRGSRAGPAHSPLDYAVALTHPAAGAAMLARPLARSALASNAAQRAMLPGGARTYEQRLLPAAGEVVGANLPPTYGAQQ